TGGNTAPSNTAPPNTPDPPNTTAPPPPTVVVGPGTGNEYPLDGVIVVENPNIVVGGEAVFRGGGCAANETLTILFDGKPVGTLVSDAGGQFAGSISIPAGTSPGAHVITVRGSACVLNVTVNVAGGLAFTGSSSHTSTLVLAGIAALVLGLVFVVGSRRRRTSGFGTGRPAT
ncbi:MAG: LPXTG cell wall anchor domain-containing protein, partial [Acidimicrobiia bacterium]